MVGGTRGIGKAIANAFCDKGHALIVLGRTVPPDDARRQYHRVDITDAAQRDSALKEIANSCPFIDNLVFVQRYRGKDDSWVGELSTSLDATRHLIDNLSGHFDPDRGGAIVMVSSVAGRLIAVEQEAGYHVARAALEQLVRYYGVTLGPRHIRVNGVCPGTVIKEESRAFYESKPALMDLYRKIIPLGRMGEATEIADVVCFLCSTAASYVTGQNLIVDGGLSLQYQESLCRKLL